MPIRLKSIDLVHEPSFIDVLFAIFRTFMKQKTRDRVGIAHTITIILCSQTTTNWQV